MITGYRRSELLFEQAQSVIPGGVNSPVRAFRQVGGTPRFIRRATGAYLYDADGNRYIDYIASWGPMILGHAHPEISAAIAQQLSMGTSYGAPTELEIDMAKQICRMAPNVDMVRMVSSGTEACMSALRLARGFTGRNKVIKFEGCYHGHADPFLVKAGSGVATLDIQTVPGIPAGASADTLVCAYNDLEDVLAVAAAHPGEVAAIIVEPVAGNMGCVPPAEGFLEGLRALCTREGIVLIFDEVMTGFRLAPGGAQQRLGVDADLITFGKVIGAGLPVGAFGGRRDIMECIAPLGQVYQAGTLSGNPIAMVAGLTMLQLLERHPEWYAALDGITETLHLGLQDILEKAGIPFTINRVGSMISLHFGSGPVTNFASAAAGDMERFKQYFHFMLQRGIYLPPSAFEAWFLNTALSTADVAETLQATEDFCASL